MKIVYLYTALTTVGGADRIITQKANYLADEMGYDVYILTDSQNGRPPIFPLSKNVKHIDVKVDFGRQYKHSLPIRFIYYKWLMYSYKKRIYRIIHQIKPDIIITTLGRDIDFITDIKGNWKIIGEAHTSKSNIRKINDLLAKGGIYKLAGQYIKYKIEKKVKQLDCLIVLNETEKNNWKGIVKTKTIANPLTIKTNRQTDWLSKNIIFVGRLEYEKGVDRLINIWEQLYAQHQDWSLQLYGTGTMKLELLQMIKNKSIKNIHIHEPVSNIEDHYSNASILILTSRYEGFGLVLLEAMSCGLPCISYDCPYGPRNIIKNSINGYLIENDNITEMKNKISLLINDYDIRKAMGEQAILSVQNYLPHKIMSQWNDLFKVLNKGTL